MIPYYQAAELRSRRASMRAYRCVGSCALVVAGVLAGCGVEPQPAKHTLLDLHVTSLPLQPARGRPAQCPRKGPLLRSLDRVRKQAQIQGLAAAVIAAGDVVFSEGFGWTDLTRTVPVRGDTPFRLASVTKPFVGIALMRAIELGYVALDDVVAIDNPHLQGEQITLQQLANHTSGIRDSDYGNYACSYHTPDGLSYMDEELQSHCPKPPIPGLAGFLDAYLLPGGSLYDDAHFARGSEAVPGTSHVYSNVGVALLGRALEEALGGSLQAFMAEQIFRPLKLRDTTWDPRTLRQPWRVAKPLVRIDGEISEFPDYRSSTWPDGGLWSSADDLARLLTVVMNGGELAGRRILQASSVARMLHPDVPTSPGDATDAYGILWEHLQDFSGHSGSDIGTLTQILFHPGTRTGLVMLANADVILSDPGWNEPLVAIINELLVYSLACVDGR